MPYCYVEDMSIVAMLRVSVKAPSSRDALFRLKQCGVFWAFFLERGHVATFLLLGFSVRCDSNRWAIPARKALLIIPAELGVCVCVRMCVCV